MKPSDAVKKGLCPNCLGKGILIIAVPPDGEEAECMTCAGTGMFPLCCTRCGGELHLNVMGDWVHIKDHDHIPRLPPPKEGRNV